MFDDFRNKVGKRPNQQESKGKVVKRKRGRSRKLNNQHLHLMMDGTLKARFSQYVQENKKGSMSRVIEDMIRELLEK